MTPMIEATGVRRSFGAVHAVRDVTFSVQAGRVTGLVGPNGSGKTTLFLMLASLLAPDAGEIRIGGFDPIRAPQDARRVLGWMPDALGAWGSLPARETLAITARLFDLAPVVARDRADELLAVVDLSDLADAPARVLSRGQKQRLGLARALVHDPAVLLLDEPASGLDPEARVHLRTLLRGFAAEGRAVLVSSHVLSELEEIADDAVYLLDGTTVAGDRVAAAATRDRAWRIVLASVPDGGEATAIAAALGVETAPAATERGGALVRFSSDVAAAEGLRRLVEAGLAVSEFSPATGALEHTLLDLREQLPRPSAPAEGDAR